MCPEALQSDEIVSKFREYQTSHAGSEILLILTNKGELEFSTDPTFCSQEDAQNLLKAWLSRESAAQIGEDRYPILSWEELQFAARNIHGKGALVGCKTKTNRYVVVKLAPTSKEAPTIAAIHLNRWSWNLI